MKRSLFDRRIPTLLAVLLLVGGLATASYLANTTLRITSQASPDETPQNIRITNLSDNRFTLTYTTSKAVLGTLTYGASQPTQPVLDDRDQKTANPKEYKTHTITVNGLQPKTTYVFSITSGTNVFLDNGKPFEVTTAPAISEAEPTDAKTITGTILFPDSKKAENILVYATAQDAQVLSTLTNSNGAYTLSLKGLRNNTLENYVSLSDETRVNVIAQSNEDTSQASFLLLDPAVPAMTLSENYDFTLGKTTLLPSNPDQGAPSFPVINANPVESVPVAIDTPQNDEQFSDQQPKFTGTAAPRGEVEITIQSEERKVTVQTDANGNWLYRPDTPLEPGEHTITIKTRDTKGLLRELSRSFVVLAEGSQFTDPSVSPKQSSPTPTLSKTSTPTVSPSPTVTPRETLAPTAIPTEEVLIIPTTTPSPTVTPRPSIAPTGTSTLSTLSVMSFAVMMLGGILLLFSKGIRI